MRIRVEPKELFMYTVYLAFKADDPEPEDEAVRAYLAQHELEPKRQGKSTVEDQEFDVMNFGGCYLGKHLKVIEGMQQKAVEQEVLRAEIERTLREAEDPSTRRAADDATEPSSREIIASLVEEFYQDTVFSTSEDGLLEVNVEAALVQRKFLELAANRP